MTTDVRTPPSSRPPPWGNPHSGSVAPAAARSSEAVSALRAHVLRLLLRSDGGHDDDGYVVVLAPDTRTAIALVVESIDWGAHRILPTAVTATASTTTTPAFQLSPRLVLLDDPGWPLPVADFARLFYRRLEQSRPSHRQHRRSDDLTVMSANADRYVGDRDAEVGTDENEIEHGEGQDGTYGDDDDDDSSDNEAFCLLANAAEVYDNISRHSEACSPTAIFSSCASSGGISETSNTDTDAKPARSPFPPRLFCYRAESDYDGRRNPLSWAAALGHPWHQGAQAETSDSHAPTPVPPRHAWRVLLDASAVHGPVDLSPGSPAAAADFVVVSLARCIGLPAPLAALIARRPTLQDLARSRAYFGGGAVAAIDPFSSTPLAQPHAPDTDAADTHLRPPRTRLHQPAALPAAFEDGSLPFLDAAAAVDLLVRWDAAAAGHPTGPLLPDLHFSAGAATAAIVAGARRPATQLARAAVTRLAALRHAASGSPVVRILAAPSLADANGYTDVDDSCGHAPEDQIGRRLRKVPDPQDTLPTAVPPPLPAAPAALLLLEVLRPDASRVPAAEAAAAAPGRGPLLRARAVCPCHFPTAACSAAAGAVRVAFGYGVSAADVDDWVASLAGAFAEK
ncbi:hypothetical protein HK405_007539 [Cladochytrium tenue]|nr:hypothetical protein HK405_007539 [Cladochytrium tenue]